MGNDILEDEANENTKYELLAGEIYKGLLNADGFNNISIQHNIKLEGKSGCQHQIDVYWEFKLAGLVQRVAIESKNYTKTVSIAKVRDFFGVIHDIGNIKGIFATKIGFQKGAKQFADYYGIELKEIRKPEQNDWTGRLKTMNLSINIMPIKVKGIFAEADLDWLIANKVISSAVEASGVKYSMGGLNAELYIYDSNGKILTNFLDLEQELPHDYIEVKNKKHTYTYLDGYMDSDHGRIKVRSIEFTYDIENVSEELVLDAEDIVKAIIKDVKSGDIQFVNNDGSVR